MTKPDTIRQIIFIGLFIFVANSFAIDLSEAYKLGEKNDPSYLQQIAAYKAVLETKPLAMAQLLPNVNFSAGVSRLNQDIASETAFGQSGEVNFGNENYSLNVRQVLFRRDRFIALDQADSQIKQAEAELARAQQDLIIRIAERYFDVLAAIDRLGFVQAEVKSLNKQLGQAKQRFAVGLNVITDLKEAQASYDLAIAEEISAKNTIVNAHEAMRELTGEYNNEFKTLKDEIILIKPEPTIIEEWTETALKQNLAIVAANEAVATAQNEIRRQSSGHYPTLDLVGSHGYQSSGGRFGTTETHTSTIGVELNIPIYSGGAISSQTRQAHERYNQALYTLEQARRAAQRLTREAYLGVITGISQVNALQQAIISSETALHSTESGFEVGTRTAVDVVVSQQLTSEARRNHSQAKYNYILNTLRLKQAAGTLSSNDLKLIDNWLM